MRIAIIGAKHLPAKEPHGIDHQIEGLALRLLRRRHTVFVYVRSDTISTPRSWRGLRLYPASSDLIAALDVMMMPVEVVHFLGASAARYAWIVRLIKPKARVVATLDVDAEPHYPWLALKAPHRRITTSHRGQIELHRRAGLPSLFIPPGVDLILPRKTTELAGLHLQKQGYILTAASLNKESNLHYLVQAFRGVKTDKKLVIVDAGGSDSEYSDYLLRLAHDDHRVVFTGALHAKILKLLLAHAYLFVDTREEVGVSSFLLEALALGIPALAAAVSENLTLCNNHCLSFAPNNLGDLRRQLQFAFDNPKVMVARGRAGRLFARKKFGWDSAVRAIENLYR